MEQELTFGQQLVGSRFNPSGDNRINKIKELAAEMVDLLADSEKMSDNKTYISNLHYGEALRRIKDASMWSVGYLTNKF